MSDIKFKSVHLKNFMSFEDTLFQLDNSGYTIVSGVNLNKDDNATSNGSGKSSCFEAIVWALTGETMRGTTDVKRFGSKDKCEVELNFDLDKNRYKIIRTKDPSNLSIFLNDKDISGKGIRDSSAKLKEYLPDLTAQLIGSVIILGQGLPMRFSNNTPSGRKEVLEKLSKSDFMLSDLKNRIQSRLCELKQQQRQIEDNLLVADVSIKSFNKQISDNEIILSNLRSNELLESNSKILESSIVEYTNRISDANLQLDSIHNLQTQVDEKYRLKLSEQNYELNEIKSKFETQLKKLNDEYQIKIQEVKDEYQVKANTIKDSWQASIDLANNEFITTKSEISSLKKQITDIKNIKDTCPTCGQKLPDVHKPDTSKLENELKDKESKKVEIESQLNSCIESMNVELSLQKAEFDKYFLDQQEKVNNEKLTIQAEYDAKLSDEKNKFEFELNSLSEEIFKLNASTSDLRKSINDLSAKKREFENNLIKVRTELIELEATRDTAKHLIEKAKSQVEIISNNIKSLEVSKENIENHLTIVNKFNTLITRDFRGILLSNIINYINSKAKEYSSIVFDTSKIDFKLDGNNILITYCDKDYTNLSCGERQRVDLIIQFALRDMLCKYLNFTSNILVLDEIVDGLDSVGCQKVMELISLKLTDVESIYIISHHSDIQMPMDNEFIITKNEDGISNGSFK